MNDMSQVIQPKADELTADDLLSGPRTVTITEVSISPGTERPVTISFEGDEGRPFKPCKTVSRILVNAWGPDAKVYVGRSMTLYRDATVKWGGLAVGGIRPSHLSHLSAPMTMALTVTKGSKKATTVNPLKVESPPKSAKAAANRAASDAASSASGAGTATAGGSNGSGGTMATTSIEGFHVAETEATLIERWAIATGLPELQGAWRANKEKLELLKRADPASYARVEGKKDERKMELSAEGVA